MSGWVLAQQLINKRTLTLFSYATLLSWVSMSAQYLQKKSHGEQGYHWIFKVTVARNAQNYNFYCTFWDVRTPMWAGSS